MTKTDVVIVGGGLCGVALAARLADAGRDYILIEGRERLGGRILTERVGDAPFDLGPAWYWPGQPRIAALVETLGLTRFDQYASGDLCFEDERGLVQRGRGFASMQGSFRVSGGLDILVQGLAAQLDPRQVRPSSTVVSVSRHPDGIEVHSAAGECIRGQRCVLALPPRIAAGLTFEPALPFATTEAMTSVPTWMAGQAKAVAVYAEPFWRKAGLSGDAMSRFGPMVEIHDASTAVGDSFALFGFLGAPPEARRDEQVLRKQVTAQLVRLFGRVAADPAALMIKDWAFDPFTSTPLDQQPLLAHPHYGPLPEMADLWDGALILSGTEVAREFGGFLEGALEAAEATFDVLL